MAALDESLFPGVPLPWQPSPIHVVELWEQVSEAETALRLVDRASLMTEDRFWEILSEPSIIGRARRGWRLLPAPMTSATRHWDGPPRGA